MSFANRLPPAFFPIPPLTLRLSFWQKSDVAFNGHLCRPVKSTAPDTTSFAYLWAPLAEVNMGR